MCDPCGTLPISSQLRFGLAYSLSLLRTGTPRGFESTRDLSNLSLTTRLFRDIAQPWVFEYLELCTGIWDINEPQAVGCTCLTSFIARGAAFKHIAATQFCVQVKEVIVRCAGTHLRCYLHAFPARRGWQIDGQGPRHLVPARDEIVRAILSFPNLSTLGVIGGILPASFFESLSSLVEGGNDDIWKR